MSRLIDRGRAMLTRLASVAAGVPNLIYIQTGTGLSTTISGSAWVGRTAFRSNLETRPSIEWSDRDYLIPIEALILGGAKVPPQRGDWLQETLAGVLKTFEIVTPDTGERAWRYSDAEETIYRVHCKRVA